MSWMPEDWMPQWLEESGYVGGCDVDEEAASPPNVSTWRNVPRLNVT